MTEARKKARIAMLQAGLTFQDLAKLTAYSVGTIHNLLSNTASMAKGRQALTNALQTELWPHVPVTERPFILPPGTEIEFPRAKQAQDAFDEATRELEPGTVTRHGRVVIFNKSVVALIPVDKPKLSVSARNREIAATSVE